eukprot:2247758-Ditylum_brightwellii.AAC.1
MMCPVTMFNPVCVFMSFSRISKVIPILVISFLMTSCQKVLLLAASISYAYDRLVGISILYL